MFNKDLSWRFTYFYTYIKRKSVIKPIYLYTAVPLFLLNYFVVPILLLAYSQQSKTLHKYVVYISNKLGYTLNNMTELCKTIGAVIKIQSHSNLLHQLDSNLDDL